MGVERSQFSVGSHRKDFATESQEYLPIYAARVFVYILQIHKHNVRPRMDVSWNQIQRFLADDEISAQEKPNSRNPRPGKLRRACNDCNAAKARFS
jgi:hypothetical protein